MGTHWGAVHVLDFEGNIIKTFQKHAATVNDISIDHAGEYVASASDDGKHIHTIQRKFYSPLNTFYFLRQGFYLCTIHE